MWVVLSPWQQRAPKRSPTSSSARSFFKSTAVFPGHLSVSHRSTTTAASSCRTTTSPALPNMTMAKGVTALVWRI